SMRTALFAALAALLLPSLAFALPEVGKPAPSFSVKDIDGKTVDTQSLLGKTVVLEWTNPTCPFVKKHYDSHNMQKLQTAATAKDVVWVTINSGSLGKVGTLNEDEAKAYKAETKLASTHYVLDTTGTLGRDYGAKTTPHMFVIDKKGSIAYMGAIDSDSSISPTAIEKADNYVADALSALSEGRPVQVSSTQSYGCGVKYAD
ncbi:MAG: redoxin domain-containing protein, partial [Rickettsiales bacterium]|nr:redoxin domain-containing protein [Rickettsiales bacterium]